MKKLRAVIRFVKREYSLLSEKRYTTLAGTLVYFLIMSITPFAVWLTLLFGRLNIDAEDLLSLPVFDSVKNLLLYIQNEAKETASGASVFLLATTLYSSTNFFYHMRRSGEIIYDFRRKKHGLAVRLSALFLMFFVMLLLVASAGIVAAGTFLFSRFLPTFLETIADYLLLLAVSFAVVLLLNAYVCPYRVRLSRLLPGALVTVCAWAIALIAFAVYLGIGNMGRLYGALSAIIVFMLWLYMLMVCFVSGVIFNSRRVGTDESEKT